MLLILQLLKANGFTLNCEEYVCTVKNLVITSKDQNMWAANNIKINYYGSVKRLKMNDQTIHYIPKGLAKWFPNLEIISIGNSKLKSIEQSDLKHFGRLKELYLHQNELEILRSDLFHFNPELIRINIKSNKLRYIGENIFYGLEKLQVVELENNVCISMNAKSQSEGLALFAKIKENCNLSDLSKRSNEVIESMTKENEGLKSQLYLLQAKLKSCDKNFDAALLNYRIATKREIIDDHPKKVSSEIDCHSEFCDLVELRVKYSNTIYDSEQELPWDQIQSLRIIVQQTLFLPNNLPRLFSRLSNFLLKESGLTEIDPTSFEGMDSLITLALINNKLTEVPSKAFTDLSALLKLDLSFNKIRLIQSDAFEGLKSLQEIKLNDNRLQTIDGRIFDGLISLEIIKLQNNYLKFITAQLLTTFHQLSLADFTNNVCVDLSFPNATKQEVEEQINDHCIAPVELKCNLNDVKLSLDELTTIDGYKCDVQNLTVELKKTKLSLLSGDHMLDYDNNNITALVAVYQTIKFMPLDIAKILPKLQQIVIYHSNLTTLFKEDLNGLIELKSISICFNYMSLISVESFDHVRKLEYMNLGYNEIETLPSQIFVNLLKLKTLILSHNKIIKLSADILPKKSPIDMFLLDHNQLELIEVKILKSIRKARLIDFTDNDCIDIKYNSTMERGKSLPEVYYAIDMNCDE